MDYKKIAGFVKKKKQLTIWERGGVQWITDGNAAYPVFGMPHMTDTEMLTFLGLSDIADQIAVHSGAMPDSIDTSELIPDDCLIEKSGPNIMLYGDVCRTYYTEKGAIVAANKYFSVVEKGLDDDVPVMLYLRGKRAPTIAVVVGMYLYALILPIGTYNDTDAEDKYAELVDMLRLARKNYGVKNEESED